jgi:hypothetical protein
MASDKKIAFVGGSVVSSENILNLDFRSDKSLLDGDMIVFSVDMSEYYGGESYRGMKCLDDDSSFRLRKDCKHWRSELESALKDGKTVIVFVNNSAEVQAATGDKQYSGTGRNVRTSRIVSTVDPYEAIPLQFGSVVRRSGERIKPVQDLGILATYWNEFGVHSTYEAYIEAFKGTPLLETQTGRKVVGGICRSSAWKGSLIFIPPPDIDSAVNARLKEFREKKRRKSAADPAGEARRTASLRKRAESSVASQFIAALTGLDNAARRATESTPPPVWTLESRFILANEITVQSAINENLAISQKLQNERAGLEQDLKNAQQLKGLLYEKGKPLEDAILVALKILGFHAENLQEEDSEFDAVILDPSGDRLIGEAEGKDDKAITVDKLDQLDRNLKEDFSRQDESAAKFAIGILFGNAYRLTTPDNREAFFTAKCLLAAKRSHIGLVRTTDLFAVAQYLDSHRDADFAGECRRAIREANGDIAVFPTVPERT